MSGTILALLTFLAGSTLAVSLGGLFFCALFATYFAMKAQR